MLNKPTQHEPAGLQYKELTACELGKGLPTVMDYLVQSTWPDGTPRETATLSVSHTEGRFLLTVRDRANKRVCFISGGTLTEALNTLEMALQSDDCSWRKDTWNKQGARK